MKTASISQFRVKLVFSRTLYSQSVASVTMGSLAAYLRSKGFQVDLCLFDRDKSGNTAIFPENGSTGNIVIAKLNFKDYPVMLPFLRQLKQIGLVQRVFLCGPFAKLNTTGLLSKLNWLDGVLLDQPEASAIRLLSTVSDDLKSWDFESLGSVSRNPVSGIIGTYRPIESLVPLSDLPFPARDIEAKEDVLFVNIEASRGCLFDCSFCHIPLMNGGQYKISPLNVRDPVLVVDEIEQLNRQMGKTLFIFNDNCFWSTKKDDARILRFCEEIVKRKLDVHFYVYLKGEPFIGDDVLHALVKAGLVRVFLGVENSVKSTLVTYRKKIRSDLYETVKAKLDPLGVNVHIGYITVEPHSSLSDVSSNIEYLYAIGKLFRLGVVLEPVRVVPGTSLHRQLVTEGLMSPKLNYDEITYGYRFVTEDVERLLVGWKVLLGNHLKDVAYRFEYYSTTGELVKVIAGRLDHKLAIIIKGHYDSFNAKKTQGMDLLLRYFSSSIELARIGEVCLIGDVEYNQRFVNEFMKITGELEVLHADLISVITQNGGERAVREVYKC